MSPVVVTWKRTVGWSRSLFSTALAVAGFLAIAATVFAFGLQSAEGGRTALIPLWASSVAPVLPALAAFLAMDVWSEERRSGRVDLLLAVAVRERSFVLGKFLGVWSMVVAALFGFLVETALLLWLFAPSALAGIGLLGLAPALLVLLVQSAVWAAAGVMFSAFFTHAAASVCSSLVFTIVLPRGVWAAMMAWTGEGRISLGEMPFDAHVADFSAGMISFGVLFSYLLVAGILLFVCTKAVAALRLVGRGARPVRLSTGLTVFLALVFAVLATQLLCRTSACLDLPVGSGNAAFSLRTRNLLAESSGDIVATCFLSRNDARFRSVTQLLRSLARQSESLGGARYSLHFVDPRWDLGAAERLVRAGVPEASLIFERGGRRAVLPLQDGCGERAVASTLRRLMTPIQRRTVYWSAGHGETLPTDYGSFGMSDIARDMVREGFQNATIDFSSDQPVPGDCALVVVAGAKHDFSRAELARLDAYLREGGRVLLLLGPSSEGGLVALLSSWGAHPVVRTLSGARTMSGSDVIVSDFADHPVSTPLRGSRIVFERPVVIEPTAAVAAGVGADRIGFTPLARLGSAALAAALERGAGAGGDLALRPTRIVAVGDATFAMNGPLAARANANRDFFLNCIAYLSGTDSSGSSGAEADLLVTGLDRGGWLVVVAVSSAGVPLGVLAVMVLLLLRRRNRG